MNKNILTTLAILISITVLIWSGCKKDDGPETKRYIIQIDSIVHPDTVNFGSEINIKFYGLIGTNGCYAFAEMIPEYIEGELRVVSWGIHTFEDDCTQALVYMNGHELIVSEVPAGEFIIKEGRIQTDTNFSGGIQGGISNGQDIYCRVAFKPVTSIAKKQNSINKNKEKVEITVHGRHDVCVVPRAVPIVEAMAAIVVLDFYLMQKINL